MRPPRRRCPDRPLTDASDCLAPVSQRPPWRCVPPKKSQSPRGRPMSGAYGVPLSRGRTLMCTVTRENVPNLPAILLALVTLALFYYIPVPADRAIDRPAAEHAVVAEVVPGSPTPQRADGVCQDAPNQHCHPLHHPGVLGATLLLAATRAAAPAPRTSSARPPLRPSRGPGGARPPDLHQLQLLRV